MRLCNSTSEEAATAKARLKTRPAGTQFDGSLADEIRMRISHTDDGSVLSTRNKRFAINMARWRLGRMLRRGGLIALPGSKYCAFLQQLALAYKYKAHEQVLAIGLEHLAILPEEGIKAFFVHMRAFVEG